MQPASEGGALILYTYDLLLGIGNNIVPTITGINVLSNEMGCI